MSNSEALKQQGAQLLQQLEKVAHEQLEARSQQGTRRIADKLGDSASRMRFVLDLVRLLEAILANWEAGRCTGWIRRIVLQLKVCYRELEDIRVEYHAEMSASVMDGEHGITEDVSYFMAVSLVGYLLVRARGDYPCCKDLLEDWPSAAAAQLFVDGESTSKCDFYLWGDRPCCTLTADELDDAFAALFQYSAECPWNVALKSVDQQEGVTDKVSKKTSFQLFGLVGSLALRANQLLGEAVYSAPSADAPGAFGASTALRVLGADAYPGHRVLWSCAVARLKMLGIVTFNWERHVLHQLDVCTAQPPSRRTSPAALTAFVVDIIGSWDGPRLREALAKAWGKRLLRLDEVGRTTAFEGGNNYCRARGSSDAVEDALHGFELSTLLSAPSTNFTGTALALRQLLLLKLLHNALEAPALCDFMQHHVVLQSMREMHGGRNGPNISLHVHRVMELPQGWAVTPHRSHYASNPVCLEEALCMWYDAHFGGSDPLDLIRWEVE